MKRNGDIVCRNAQSLSQHFLQYFHYHVPKYVFWHKIFVFEVKVFHKACPLCLDTFFSL